MNIWARSLTRREVWAGLAEICLGEDKKWPMRHLRARR